ncbi:hypothetical protein BSKO_04120 [Bryopsis sp. KO-2023]|nr:hypothetical protein BSKO_04120 [Bryopsis sp. KO-2023]
MVGSEQAVSLDHLLQEVAICSYAIRQGVDFVTMKRLWDSLGSFVRSMLRAHKGVLLPCLGTFHVGPAMLDSQRQSDCIVPAFRLLEGRFAGVSHEVIRMRPAGKGSVVPPNYQLMSTEVGKHRSTCQRLIKDLLQRAANHILMGHAINIPFPTVGNLVTNKAGRVQLKFEKELLEQLKSQPLPLRPTTSASTRQTSNAPTERGDNNNNTDEEAESAEPQCDPPIQTALRNPRTPADVGMPMVTSIPQRTIPMDAQHRGETSEDSTGLWINSLHDLARLCTSADKARSGCIGRIQLEWWLQRQGRVLVSALDAASVLDLLQVHSYGSSGKFIVYGTFLEGLWRLIEEVREEKMLGNRQGQAEILRIQTPLLESTLEPSLEPPLRFQVEECPEKKEQAMTNIGNQRGRNHEVPEGRNPEDIPIDHEPYFLQTHTHSLSRGDCDKFNEYHFRRLISSRGGTRELPPKVGAEPLTEEEVKLLRSSSPERIHRTAAHMASEKDKSERRQRGSGVGPGRAVVPELLGEHISNSDAKAKELEIQKRKNTRAFLRSSWERQAKEKAKVMELFQTAEDKWPYMPSPNPHHDHYPIKSPRYVSPHYVRPVDAPDPSYNLPPGCSMWSGL